MLDLTRICFCFAMRATLCSLFLNAQANEIEAFNFTSRYLDDLLNIDTPNIEQIVI